MRRGKFITLEGGEGVGKTTNLAFVVERLKSRDIDVVATREPGGTALGETVRSILLNHTQVLPEAELLLIFAARLHHIRETIEPALRNGRWVVSDRFTDASYAYQGAGRGIDASRIEYLENWIQKDLRPDLTFLFDAPVEVGMERARKRSGSDRFEGEGADFFRRVREAYLTLARREPERVRPIDAARPLAEVQEQIAAELDSWVSAHEG
jgi:dTMP kinase